MKKKTSSNKRTVPPKAKASKVEEWVAKVSPEQEDQVEDLEEEATCPMSWEDLRNHQSLEVREPMIPDPRYTHAMFWDVVRYFKILHPSANI